MSDKMEVGLMSNARLVSISYMFPPLLGLSSEMITTVNDSAYLNWCPTSGLAACIAHLLQILRGKPLLKTCTYPNQTTV